MTDRRTLLGWLDGQQSSWQSGPLHDDPITKKRGDDNPAIVALEADPERTTEVRGEEDLGRVQTRQRGDEPEPETAQRQDE